MTPDRAEVLALVRSSPAYVAVHDKVGWVGIFGQEHVVEDPVGAGPVRSQEPCALERFWDTFIAPNDIAFEVAQDWIDGFDVVRDATIVTTLAPGVVVRTPAHLIYQTTYEDGALKVRRMAAYWEPLPVYRQLMLPRRAYVVAALGQFAHMFRTLGIGAALRFVGAARFVGRRRKQVLLAELAANGVREVSKVIAAGNSVTASGTQDGAPVAVIADFAPRSHTLRRLKTYEDLA
ncbi:hypothetical protein ASE12_12705 [Aeromicrobium sp. Root236]|uniref:hypothetical protein n=1 Tax=Aeromicrobium sp. Root236 TaxID=1736498 RepID=UPI0006F7A87D|nr:hypothetical protein [Aeromicrobium sp. Root236]KRC65538.1 hypothetical protein ASE12_12705 [Aeromicrobium sp. Root236]